MESELATVSTLLGKLNDLINTHIKNSTDERTKLAWVRQACKVAELLLAYERNNDLRIRIERIEEFANELQQAYFDSLRRHHGTQSN